MTEENEGQSVEQIPYFVGKVWTMGKRVIIGFPKGVKALEKGSEVYVYKAPVKVEIYNQDLSLPICTLDGSDFRGQKCKIKELALQAGKNPDAKCRLCLLNQLCMKLK